MLLVISAIINETGCPNHMRWVDDYEMAFELLTQLTTEGWALQQAHLVDNGNVVRLPVEAFDGESLMGPIQKLQKQWQQVLSGVPDLDTEAEITEAEECLVKLVAFYEKEIDAQTYTVWRLHTALDRLHHSRNTDTQQYCINLLNRLIQYHAGRLEKAKIGHQRVAKRLSLLYV